MKSEKAISIEELNVADIVDDQPEAQISSDLPLRKWLHAWLLDPNIPGNHQKGFDRWIGILIVVNLFALVFEHVPAVYEANKQWFHSFDIFSVGVFTLE